MKDPDQQLIIDILDADDNFQKFESYEQRAARMLIILRKRDEERDARLRREGALSELIGADKIFRAKALTYEQKVELIHKRIQQLESEEVE